MFFVGCFPPWQFSNTSQIETGQMKDYDKNMFFVALNLTLILTSSLGANILMMAISMYLECRIRIKYVYWNFVLNFLNYISRTNNKLPEMGRLDVAVP